MINYKDSAYIKCIQSKTFKITKKNIKHVYTGKYKIKTFYTSHGDRTYNSVSDKKN